MITKELDGLTKALAYKYKIDSISEEDLYQEGILAIYEHQKEYNYKLSSEVTFYYFWIRRYMQDSIRKFMVNHRAEQRYIDNKLGVSINKPNYLLLSLEPYLNDVQYDIATKFSIGYTYSDLLEMNYGRKYVLNTIKRLKLIIDHSTYLINDSIKPLVGYKRFARQSKNFRRV